MTEALELLARHIGPYGVVAIFGVLATLALLAFLESRTQEPLPRRQARRWWER